MEADLIMRLVRPATRDRGKHCAVLHPAPRMVPAAGRLCLFCLRGGHLCLERAMGSAGLDFYGFAPPLDTPRGEEINADLKHLGTPVERFIILEDRTDRAPHADRLVKTDETAGLTDAEVARAIEMLNG